MGPPLATAFLHFQLQYDRTVLQICLLLQFLAYGSEIRNWQKITPLHEMPHAGYFESSTIGTRT